MSEGEILKSTLSGQQYTLGRPLRFGTLAVYEAQTGDGQRCWIKQAPADDETAIARLRYETIVRSKLQHSGLLRLLDRGRSRSRFFLALEAPQGHSLLQIMDAGTCDLAWALRVAQQLAALLEYLHSQGIVCRTLPPSALFIDHLDRVLLIDLTAAWDEVSPPRSGELIAQGSYISPEEAGGNIAQRRSDIYVYGVLLFELLAGRPPFQGVNRGDVALQHMLTPPPDIRTLRPDLSGELAQIIDTCLAKTPAQRFRTAAALSQALRAVERPESESPSFTGIASTPIR